MSPALRLVLQLCASLQLASGLQQAALNTHASSRLGLSRFAQCSAMPGGLVATSALRSSELLCMAGRSEDAKMAASAAAEAPSKAQAQQQQQQQQQKPEKKKRPGVHGKPFVVGLSHKTATVEVREKLSILEAQWNEASQRLTEYDSIQEAAVLSTCNRFEVYVVAEDHFEATRDTMAFLREHSGLSDEELRPNLFVLNDEDATWHLLRVSSGLDSLVVGEGQILSQVKACYSHAIAGPSEDEPAGSGGKVLGRLLNSAVMAGKFVRSETEIAKGAVSISSAAVELAMLKAREDLQRPLPDLRITVVGAGKMSRLLFTHLASHGVTKITLINRSRPRADELAAEYPDLDVDVKLSDELWPTLEETDLAFTSTSATGCIVTKDELMGGVWGKGETPMMLIDISVPRNVEAQCNDVDGIFAYNVDDLKQVVAANQAKRRHKVLEAEILLRIEHAKFVQWQESLRYVPAIGKLQKKFEQIRTAELAKAQKKGLKGLSDKERQAVDVATKGIINKLLHGPMSYLRSDGDGEKATVQQIEDIFLLDKD
jgi:glutamyl-tRNA reductase